MSHARRVRLVGIGCGDPDQLTLEAVKALRTAAFALVSVKRDDDPLAAARRAIIEQHAPQLRVLEVRDPERDRSASSTGTQSGYEGVVDDWHEARAAAWEAELEVGWSAGGGDAVLLVWGDPAFYDSTIRVVERVLARGRLDFTWDVLPGISALQLLAARHRVVLHEVGEPVLVTTARRLRAAIDAGADNVVVMLGAALDLAGVEDWTIWWGANLGSPEESLVSGRVGDVLPDIESARAAAKERAGWVMDVYLLRRPQGSTHGLT